MEKKFKISLLAASVVMGLSLTVTNVAVAETPISDPLKAALGKLTDPTVAGEAKNYTDALGIYANSPSTDPAQYEASVSNSLALQNALYDYYAKQQERQAVERVAGKYLQDVYGSTDGKGDFAKVFKLSDYYDATTGTINNTTLNDVNAKDSAYARLIAAATTTTGRTVAEVAGVKGLVPAIADLKEKALIAIGGSTGDNLPEKLVYYSGLIKEQLKINALSKQAEAAKIKLAQAANEVVKYIAIQEKDSNTGPDSLKSALDTYLKNPSELALGNFLADPQVIAELAAHATEPVYLAYSNAKSTYGDKDTPDSALGRVKTAIDTVVADYRKGSTNATNSNLADADIELVVTPEGEINYQKAKSSFVALLDQLKTLAEQNHEATGYSGYAEELTRAVASWQAYDEAYKDYTGAKQLADKFTTRLAEINAAELSLGTAVYRHSEASRLSPVPSSYSDMDAARQAMTTAILSAVSLNNGDFDLYKQGVVTEYNNSLLNSAADVASIRNTLVSTQVEVAQAKLKALAYLATIEDFDSDLQTLSQSAANTTEQYSRSKAAYQQAKAVYDAAVAMPKKDGSSTSAPLFVSASDQADYELAKAGLLAAALKKNSGKPALGVITDLLQAGSYQAKDYDEIAQNLRTPLRLTDYRAMADKVSSITNPAVGTFAKHRSAIANSVYELNHGWRYQGINQNNIPDGFAAYQAAVDRLVNNPGAFGPYGKTVAQIVAERTNLGHDRYLDQKLFLGALPVAEAGIQGLNTATPHYNGIVLNNVAGSYQPKVSFSAADLAALNLSSKESPFRNTLNLQIADLNPSGDFSKNNELVLGDSNASASLWFTAKDMDLTLNSRPASTALNISGHLLDSNFTVIGADGLATQLAPHTAGQANAYDKITLQNLNINMVESAKQLEQERMRRVADLQAEIANMRRDGSTAADIASYTAEQQASIDKWLSKMSLKTVDQVLTGLRIGASTTTQVLGSLTNGSVGTAGDAFQAVPVEDITGVADTSVPHNIVLNHVGINVQNDTGSYLSSLTKFDGLNYAPDGHSFVSQAAATAIDVSANGDHLQISNSIIEAHTIPGGTETALALNGYHNRADFSNSQLYGSIVDNHTTTVSDGSPKQNLVTLTDSSWTGDAQSENTNQAKADRYIGQHNYLQLQLTDSIWKGSSSKSPDVTLAGDKQGSSWYVASISSVNSLTFSGSGNTLNLVPTMEQVRSGYQPLLVNNTPVLNYTPVLDYVAAEGYGKPKLEVERDLTLGASSVSTIIASAYERSGIDALYNQVLPYGYRLAQLRVDGLLLQQDPDVKKAGKLVLSLASHGAQPYETIDGKLADDADDIVNRGLRNTPHAFVVFKTDDRDTDVSMAAPSLITVKSDQNAITGDLVEAGVYQYQMVTEANENPQLPDYGYTSVFYQRNGHISNSAATATAIAAAPADVATMENDALDKHITSLRHSESSGVWIAYYGGRNKNSLQAGHQAYNLKTSGVILGADTSFDDRWTAGVAFNSGKSNLSVLNSSGDVKGYGAQFWLSRHYSNGMFVNGDAQFGHYSNTLKVRMLNGEQGRADYATNGYGLTAKAGYSYQHDSGFYAEPYVKASARAFSGAAYNMTNGMIVNSTDYKSLVGELGADLGYTMPTNQGYVKPYLHLAVLDEFASRNHVRVNNIDLNNSIDGAAFRVGVGGEVKLMQNLGGYASFDYTKGSDIERPWQVNVGINYTW